MSLKINKNQLVIITFISLFVVGYVKACQETEELSCGELWARLEETERLKKMLFRGVMCCDGRGFGLVQQALREGVDPDVRGENDRGTALIIAAFNGYEAITQLLLDANANPNIQDNSGYTALIWSIYNRRAGVSRLLLEAGAKVDIKNRDGETALITAVEVNETALVRLLLDFNAEINIKNNKRQTALDIAQKKGCYEIAKMLQDEPERRKEIKQEVFKYLPDVLANLVYEYFVFCPKQ